MAEAGRLALAAAVAPGGVLLGQAHNELVNLSDRRRAAEPPVWVRPLPRHQPTVPGEDRRRLDDEGRPPLQRQHRSEGGEQGPIGVIEGRPG
jgi:hypothetical protein